jgi:hypothetical protein
LLLGASAAGTMNAFRLAGDMMHLLSIVVLLLKIRATRSCRGVRRGAARRRQGAPPPAAPAAPPPVARRAASRGCRRTAAPARE